jgi:hypothetical protein
MNYNNLIGVENGKVNWRKPLSIVLALSFPLVVKFALSSLGGVNDTELVNGLIYNFIIIGFSILVCKFLNLKSILLNVLIISVISGLISGTFHSSNLYVVTYIHFVVGNFIMLFTWAGLIMYIEKRKLVLVLGYFISTMYSAAVVVIRMTKEVPEISPFKLAIDICTTYIFWTLLFWIGLLLFDKILKVKASTVEN